MEELVTGLLNSTKIVDPLLCRHQRPPDEFPLPLMNEYLRFMWSQAGLGGVSFFSRVGVTMPMMTSGSVEWKNVWVWEELPRSDAKIMLQNRVNDFRIKVFTGRMVYKRRSQEGALPNTFPEFFGDGAHEIYAKMNPYPLLIPKLVVSWHIWLNVWWL